MSGIPMVSSRFSGGMTDVATASPNAVNVANTAIARELAGNRRIDHARRAVSGTLSAAICRRTRRPARTNSRVYAEEISPSSDDASHGRE